MLPTLPVRGDYFRCVSVRRDPLSTEGARLNGGRFNVAGEPALYLARTPALAVAEHLRLGEVFGIIAFPPRLLVTVQVDLPLIVDLTDPRTCRSARISADELGSAWYGVPGPTAARLLGRRLRRSGVMGLLAPSSLDPTQTNLVVFSENLGSGGWVRVVGAE